MNQDIRILIRLIDFVFSGHCQMVIHTSDAIYKLEKTNVPETQEMRDLRDERNEPERTD